MSDTKNVTTNNVIIMHEGVEYILKKVLGYRSCSLCVGGNDSNICEELAPYCKGNHYYFVELNPVPTTAVTEVNQKDVLLKAAYEVLKACDEGHYVKHVLQVPVDYNNHTGDGFSLMNDIAAELGIEE